MTYREILVLLNAGYTKSEIDAMSDDKPAEETNIPDVQEHSEPVKVPETETSSASDTNTNPVPPADGTELDRLSKQLAELTAAMQSANRSGAEMGGQIIGPKEAGINILREIGGVPAQNKKE